MRCPICDSLCGEFINKAGTTYTCSNIIVMKDKYGKIINEKKCTWSGQFVPNQIKRGMHNE
jgi:hypothetical protein